MLALEGKDFLRVAILGGVLGFSVFCLSYGFTVWRKRNSRGRSRPTLARRLSYLCLILGAFGLLANWAFRELDKREGIAGGGDLFVVHARRDNSTLRLTAQDEIHAGDVIAEFVPPANQSQITVKEFQQAQAQARMEAVRAKPLAIDQALIQRETQLRLQIIQEEGFLLELQRSRRDVDKGRSELLTTWTRDKNQIDSEIAAAEKVRAAATGQLEIARAALQQASDAFKKQLVTQPVFDDRRSAFIKAELEANKQQAALTSLASRRQSLEERFKTSDDALAQQAAQIADNTTNYSKAVETHKAELAETERLIADDRARAKDAVEREVEAAKIETSIAAAEKERSIETTQIKAPFSGHVVFRHPTPGLAGEGAAILALSAGPGFMARIRMPESEVGGLADHRGPVPLALEHPVLHNVITGRFVRAEPLPLEKGQAIALFECALPSEVIAGLGNSAEPVRVRLLWKPSLLENRAFEGSAALAALGLLGVLFSGYRPAREGDQAMEADQLSQSQDLAKSAPATSANGMDANGRSAGAEVVDIRSRMALDPQRGSAGRTDAARELLDRTRFLAAAEAEVQRAAQAGTPIAVLMIVVNEIRSINASHGRKTGDAILKGLADFCQGSRERDLAGRWTGESFVLLLPETDRAGATVVAERVRARMEQLRSGEFPHVPLSVGIGISEVMPGETTTLPALLRAEQECDAGSTYAEVASGGA